MKKKARATSEFVAEATEILEALGRDLMVLDTQRGGEPAPELLNRIFRAAHSLKGLAAMFNQDRLATLAHRAEDLLDALRLGKVPLDDALVDALSDALEVFSALLADAAGDEETQAVSERAQAMAARLLQLCQRREADEEDLLDQVGLDPQLRSVFTEYEEHRLRENVRRGVGLWRVRAVFGLDDFDQRLARLNAALKPLGEVVSTLPSSQPGDEATIAFDLIFGSAQERPALEAALGGTATVSPLTQRQAAARGPPSPRAFSGSSDSSGPFLTPVPQPGPGAQASLRSLTQTVRVDIGRLDGLMNTIGELLLIRGNLQRLADAARAGSPAQLPRLFGQELQREARSLERKLEELQKGVLEVRMVPLVQVFDKLARLMRRLVRESGKELDFEVSGGDVELDKLIVEELSDPLMHLLRNALDHGVEAPQVREANGKPARATVRLFARQQGNHVVIEVGDDGAGMHDARIREAALRRGLVTEAQTEAMDRRDLLNLVFLPGFSTREDVSELSGRGVGLDVVKTNLGRLSGLIDIDSVTGKGTTFTLTLPLTLAIIRALMVEANGRTYAVPLNSVLEIVSVKAAELRTIERREVLDVRGQTLPFVRLSRIFGLPERPVDRHYVVIIGLAQHRLGLAVDALISQQDIVTKPLGGRLKQIPGISGATELGDRRAVLVLDVAALMEELLRPRAAVS